MLSRPTLLENSAGVRTLTASATTGLFESRDRYQIYGELSDFLMTKERRSVLSALENERRFRLAISHSLRS